MGLRINQNVAAMNAYRNLSVTDNQMSKSLEKLSSGFRINRAADDAAGLSISEGLRSQIGGLKVAVRNAQDGVNVVQTADGALNETTAILQRMRDLAVQAANGGSQDKNAQGAAQTEFGQLSSELDRIANTTAFGGQKLLDTNYKGDFQVGANNTANDRLQVKLDSTVFGTPTTASDATVATAGTAGKVSVTGGVFTNPTGDFTVTQGSVSSTVALTSSETTSALTAAKLNASTDFASKFTAADNSGKLEITAKAIGSASNDYTAGNLTLSGSSATAIGGTKVDTAGVATIFNDDAKLASASGFTAAKLGITSAVKLDGTDNADGVKNARAAINVIDNALKGVSTARATIGAYQNRFEHTINNLNVAVENLSASESQIRDTDMAKEMTSFTRSQILQQAGTSMLAQANSSQQSVLKLLG